MDRKYTPVRGHEPLRVPQGWTDQDKALIIQLERLFDDLYRRFGSLRRKDLGEELNALLDELIEETDKISGILTRVTALETLTGSTALPTTAQTITGAIAEHETDITGIGNTIGNTSLPTTAQTLTGAIAEHETDLTGIGNKIGSTTLPTTAQTLTGAIAENTTTATGAAAEIASLWGMTVATLKGK